MVNAAQMDIDPKELAAQFAEARALKKEEASGVSSELAKQVQHKNELQFKTSHGLLVAFLLWIWFVSFAQSS